MSEIEIFQINTDEVNNFDEFEDCDEPDTPNLTGKYYNILELRRWTALNDRLTILKSMVVQLMPGYNAYHSERHVLVDHNNVPNAVAKNFQTAMCAALRQIQRICDKDLEPAFNEEWTVAHLGNNPVR